MEARLLYRDMRTPITAGVVSPEPVVAQAQRQALAGIEGGRCGMTRPVFRFRNTVGAAPVATGS